jgi:oligopeptide/dipeptide ABC transporter ATP-binding protein
MTDELLEAENVSVVYKSSRGSIKALDDISFTVTRGEFIALVGESGCGKSTLGLSILRLLPPSAEIKGRMLFNGRDLNTTSQNELGDLRGTGIGMIFQEPLSALNPIERIGGQMAEAIQIARRRLGNTVTQSNGDVVKWLKEVRIPDPEKSMGRYPFQLSGGMAQRVMIAMALSQKPTLLIADEPTSALDVTTQAQIIQLMKELADESHTAIMLITHDLGVAAQVANRILVMYAGWVVEEGSAKQIFSNPLHPYTQALLRCYPHGTKSSGRLDTIKGSIPDLASKISGCKFAERCPLVKQSCIERKPLRVERETNHYVKCVLYE